ncbi:MAG TPA: hypothetical protein VIQ00_08480 [Chitinophagaceae bacterium]|jgi:hypothetical protein
MNSRYLMIASSIVTGLLGLTASFFPKEILTNVGLFPTEILTLFLQVTGALYIGFAILNWMAKTVLIGGIYARPLAMGNFAHFMIAAIALAKAALNNSVLPYLWIIAVIYSIFAVLFGIVLFTNPVKKIVV